MLTKKQGLFYLIDSIMFTGRIKVLKFVDYLAVKSSLVGGLNLLIISPHHLNIKRVDDAIYFQFKIVILFQILRHLGTGMDHRGMISSSKM
jgi:hypothetical protein